MANAVAEFRESVVCWYRSNGRSFPWRSASTCYEHTVAELLLQRTAAATVKGFYPEFLQRFPTWDSLSNAGPEELEPFFRRIGLWNRRASALMSLAAAVVLRGGALPRTRAELEALPGIGQYVASAVMTLCYGQREPLLDSSMARVLERVFGSRKQADIRNDAYLQGLSRAVVDCEGASEVNWAVLDLAAALCRPSNPRCAVCPVRSLCRYARKSS